MSLHDILMERAALEHPEFRADFGRGEPSTALDNLSELALYSAKLAQDQIAEEQKAERERQSAIEKSKMAIESFKTSKSVSDGGRITRLIPKLEQKEDGTFEFSQRTPTVAESKTLKEEDFAKSVQSGESAMSLRLKYPMFADQIDKLEIAGTVSGGGLIERAVVGGNKVVIPQESTIQGAVAVGKDEGKIEFVPKGYDSLGRVTGYERIDKSESEKKRTLEITELDASIKNMVNAFGLAQQEAKKNVKGFGKPGLEGRILSQEAIIRGKIGESPNVNVYQDRIKAFATTVAKAAGEVRPTDMDIMRFIQTLPSIEKNDAENEIIINGLINDLKARGAKSVWLERSGGSSVSEQSPKQMKVGRFIVEVNK
jgi:hypothetical protein